MISNYKEALFDYEQLETKNLILRKFKKSDVEDVYEYGSDEETVKYLVWDANNLVHYRKEKVHSSVEIRLVRYDELPKLLNLYKHLHMDDPAVSNNEALKQIWDEIYIDPNLHYVVIEEGGELVSTCNITIIKNLTRGLRPYGLIENVVTHKDYRKRGYGTKVLHRSLEIAKENNCYKVMLMTSSKSEDTLRFYEKAGFSIGVKTGFVINL